MTVIDDAIANLNDKEEELAIARSSLNNARTIEVDGVEWLVADLRRLKHLYIGLGTTDFGQLTVEQKLHCDYRTDGGILVTSATASALSKLTSDAVRDVDGCALANAVQDRLNGLFGNPSKFKVRKVKRYSSDVWMLERTF